MFEKVELKNFTSLRLGGSATLVRVKNKEELLDIYKKAKLENLDLCILGEGTNTFFADSLPLNLLVLRIEIKGVEIKEDGDFVYIKTGAGEIFDDIVKLSVDKNWWGIENLSDVPGSCGSALIQNIGAYGAEIKNVVFEATVFDSSDESFKVLNNIECDFGYRDSVFKKDKNRYIICDITIRLSKNRNPILVYAPLNTLNTEVASVCAIRDLIVKTRAEKLPDYKKFPNAGSYFKNISMDAEGFNLLKEKYPEIPFYPDGEKVKVPIAWIIEHVIKMKGVIENGVGTWSKHSLVLVNYENVKSSQLIAFEEKIKEMVLEKTGIEIEREVNFVGC